MQLAYIREDTLYPGIAGLSTLFRPGASLDELAREGAFPHAKLSYSVIGRGKGELASAGFSMILYRTPNPAACLPDHHTLAVAQTSVVAPALADAAADALIRALDVGIIPID